MKKDTTYNGWKNKATWNVALWISNEEGMYLAAVDFMGRYRGRVPYAAFIRSLGLQYEKTEDGFAWLGSRLCLRELNEMMKEFAQ